ncbi:MAG TPA: hypothetical protein PKN13_00830 [Accumulibacter sp.]|nr:hypothetical protein [Accumulibacter sp.]HNC18747.1 hypothetical protein [Accumulibacter sp.]HND78850.1 hypothetical protein [Accumulibacter sp.]HNG38072.1 hypothetical protein [Accumulibacter sp.]HNI72242.1 hypothetical protein [Accumulibacter sp.]
MHPGDRGLFRRCHSRRLAQPDHPLSNHVPTLYTKLARIQLIADSLLTGWINIGVSSSPITIFSVQNMAK